MKICPSCQECNHDAAENCLLCGTTLRHDRSQRQTPQGQHSSGEDAFIVTPSEPVPPPAGSLAIAIYHDREPRILKYYPITTDITVVGREDPARNLFPDIDLGEFRKTEVSIEHVSRQHFRLSRRRQHLQIFVFLGSTGTQLNRRLLHPGKSAVLKPGDRIILGGMVRLKLLEL